MENTGTVIRRRMLTDNVATGNRIVPCILPNRRFFLYPGTGALRIVGAAADVAEERRRLWRMGMGKMLKLRRVRA